MRLTKRLKRLEAKSYLIDVPVIEIWTESESEMIGPSGRRLSMVAFETYCADRSKGLPPGHVHTIVVKRTP